MIVMINDFATQMIASMYVHTLYMIVSIPDFQVFNITLHTNFTNCRFHAIKTKDLPLEIMELEFYSWSKVWNIFDFNLILTFNGTIIRRIIIPIKVIRRTSSNEISWPQENRI